MKYKLSPFLILLTCYFSAFVALRAEDSDLIRKNLTKDELIELDLKEARDKLLSNRNYSIEGKTDLRNLNIFIEPFNLISEETPDWWSEKQSFDMAYLLKKALEHYPGINVSLTKTWEQNLLEKENIVTQNQGDSLQNTIKIAPFLEDYKYQVLTPKTRGVGIGYVAFNRKTCKNETFLATKYQFDSGLNSKIFIEDVISKQLLQKKKSGASLNVNLLFAGVGGGKFKAPEKPIKEIVYNSVVDSAEGIYCSISNNKECISFYQKREYNFPTIEKKRRRKKKDKSC